MHSVNYSKDIPEKPALRDWLSSLIHAVFDKHLFFSIDQVMFTCSHVHRTVTEITASVRYDSAKGCY